MGAWRAKKGCSEPFALTSRQSQGRQQLKIDTLKLSTTDSKPSLAELGTSRKLGKTQTAIGKLAGLNFQLFRALTAPSLPLAPMLETAHEPLRKGGIPR